MLRILGICLVLLLVGCTSQGMSLTLAAEHQVKSTEFYDVQATASVQAGRLQSTQDYYTTDVAFVATQSQFLKATLVARGTPADILNQVEVEALPTRTPRPTPTFAPLIPPTPYAGATGAPEDQSAVSAKGGAITDPQAALTAAPLTSGPRLTNLMVSAGVGKDDCAINPGTSFPTSTSQIYVVATAYEVASGMTLSSQWEISGQKRTYDFVPDFAIDGACIWFYIDQSEFAFQPGAARVSLTLNGTAMGTVDFTLN